MRSEKDYNFVLTAETVTEISCKTAEKFSSFGANSSLVQKTQRKSVQGLEIH